MNCKKTVKLPHPSWVGRFIRLLVQRERDRRGRVKSVVEKRIFCAGDFDRRLQPRRLFSPDRKRRPRKRIRVQGNTAPDRCAQYQVIREEDDRKGFYVARDRARDRYRTRTATIPANRSALSGIAVFAAPAASAIGRAAPAHT